MFKPYLFFVLPMLLCINGFSQVGIGTTTPDPSSILELKATDKGLLPPRMNAAQRDLIPVPKAGLMIYQTDGSKGLYVYNGASWQPVAGSGSGWSLTGNAGTNPAINFIGTIDAQPLVFKVANANAGRIGSDGLVALGRAASNNFSDPSIIAIGDSALYSNGTGSPQGGQSKQNTALGSHVLFANTTGQNNTAAGFQVLLSNTSGFENAAFGNQALLSNTSGYKNIAMGGASLHKNTTGIGNTATGYHSLYANTTANYNTAHGFGALEDNTTGELNTAVGFNALSSNTSGINNTALGAQAALRNKTGNDNISIGFLSQYSNEAGNDNVSAGSKALYSTETGHSNIALGAASLYSNQSSSSNVAIGDSALYNNRASANTAIGSKALFNNDLAIHNTAIGFNAAYNNDGNNNTAIGFKSLYTNSYGTDNTATGYQSLFNNNGYHNVAYGNFSAGFNVAGNDNTAMGYSSLFSNTSGYGNVALGSNALYKNKIGSNSVAIGDSALYNNLQAYNTATGSMALYKNVDGFYNQANGYVALYNTTSGNANTASGTGALQSNTTGSNNSALGYNADVTSGNLFNATAIGAEATVACSNCLALGAINSSNGFTSTTKVDVGIGTNSPQTDLHINPDGAGSILIGTNRAAGGYTNLEMGISSQSGGYSTIQSTKASGSAYGNLSLNPFGGNVGVRMAIPLAPLHIKQSSEAYPVNGGGLRMERQTNSNHWDVGTDLGDDLDFTYNGITRSYLDNATGAYVITSDLRLKKDIALVGSVLPSLMLLEAKSYHYRDNEMDAPRSYGFIAQDVEKLYPDFVTTKGPDNIKAIAYQNFGVIAIKAIQEQQRMIESLQKQVDVLKTEGMAEPGKQQVEIDALKAQVKTILAELEKLKK